MNFTILISNSAPLTQTQTCIVFAYLKAKTTSPNLRRLICTRVNDFCDIDPLALATPRRLAARERRLLRMPLANSRYQQSLLSHLCTCLFYSLVHTTTSTAGSPSSLPTICVIIPSVTSATSAGNPGNCNCASVSRIP